MSRAKNHARMTINFINCYAYNSAIQICTYFLVCVSWDGQSETFLIGLRPMRNKRFRQTILGHISLPQDKWLN